jgi:hypothetical protein
VSEGQLWRVGHRDDPLAFTPFELCGWNHRFDDAGQGFRTIYCAENSETSVREVLADFRPNLAARRAFVDVFGEEALEDLPSVVVTARWREEHVLAPAAIDLDGERIDLTDTSVRADLERRHAELLLEHDLQHLDLHEITGRRRAVTQAIATDLFNHGAAALRFPSRLDGRPALALFEDRGELLNAGQPIKLTDPAPEVLLEVCEEWGLELESS